MGENSSSAYTASGAFVGWLKEKFGAEPLRAWYGGSDLGALVSKSWSELEAAWLADLDLVVLPEALGDIAVLGGDEPRAALRYAEVMSRLVDEDALRTLEVKMGAAKDPRARPGIIALLIGTPPRAPDKVRAATLLAEWGMIAPDDGLPQYLIARQYMATNELEQAGERLDAALGKRLSILRVAIEAERLRLIVACGVGDAGGIERRSLAIRRIPR